MDDKIEKYKKIFVLPTRKSNTFWAYQIVTQNHVKNIL